MKGDKIPDQDHIARYCKRTTVPDGQIQATAFMVRTGEESLSVNWLEFLKCSSRAQEITELRKILARKLNIPTGTKIAVLTVGDVCKKILTESSDRRNIEVLHDPMPSVDLSHSGIYNLKYDDEEIAELILETVNESYVARL